MRRGWFVVNAGLVVAVGACQLFFPFDIQVDASVDAGDAGTADVTTDVDAADAPPPFDGTLPTNVVSFVGKGSSLTVDDTHLYWFLQHGGNPKLMVTRKDDGGTTVLLADAGSNAMALVVDSDHLYWVDVVTQGGPNGGAVLSLDKDGGGFAVLASKGDWWPDSIAVDDTSVYILNPYASSEPLVARVPKDGGAFVWLEGLTSADPFAESIVVDDASVYRVHQSVISSYPKGCSLEAGTCVVQPLMVENVLDYCVRDIAVDDTGLYWVQYSGNAPCAHACGVYRTPKTGGTTLDAAVNLYPSTLACGRWLTLAGPWAYTISTGAYEIIAVGKDGGNGAISPAQLNPFNSPVVADDASIYWIDDYNTGNGRIMKLAR